MISTSAVAGEPDPAVVRHPGLRLAGAVTYPPPAP
jgi:hypothetical protein